MTDSRYLKLLWIYVGLMVFTILASNFHNYSESLTVAYENEPMTWFMSNILVVIFLGFGMVVAWLIGLIGLFYFKSWARPLSFYSTLAIICANAFSGAVLLSGFENALFEASATIWGAILALSYFSSVSSRFER